MGETFDQIEFLSVTIKETVDLATRLEARRKLLFTSFEERLRHLASVESPAFVDSHILSEEGAYHAYLAAVKAKQEAEETRVAAAETVAHGEVAAEETLPDEVPEALVDSSAPASPSQVAALVHVPEDVMDE